LVLTIPQTSCQLVRACSNYITSILLCLNSASTAYTISVEFQLAS
jgi:hypothetical protein